MSNIHPVYGQWESGWKVVNGFEKYEVNHLSEVRSRRTQKLLVPSKRAHVNIFDAHGRRHNKFVYHLTLATFFPNVPRNNLDVDHIDENHDNHYINNLQWLSRSENSRKSSKLRPNKSNGPARSKSVEQYSADGVFICTFKSVMEAEQKTGISNGNIARSARSHIKAGGFQWKYAATLYDIPEIWASNDELKNMLRQKGLSERAVQKIKVSNLGRILTAQNSITKGAKDHTSCYRVFHDFQVHRLVWTVWGDGRPAPQSGDSLKILHDDTIEKDQDGCVSNAIEHLSLGTQSENLSQYHQNKKRAILFQSKFVAEQFQDEYRHQEVGNPVVS